MLRREKDEKFKADTLLFLAVLSHILVKTFATSQIFAFNPVLGFFPGITYDESLHVTGRLAMYRAGTLVATALLVLLADLVIKHRKKERLPSMEFFGGMVGLVLVCGLFFFSNQLGLSSSESFISSTLGGVDSTEHFVIHYPKNILSAQKARELALLHEFYFWSIAHQLRVFPLRRPSRRRFR